MRPKDFWELTVAEFQDLLEAAAWREARVRKLVASSVLQLLQPYMKPGTDIQWELDGMFHGDPEARVEAERDRRLRRLVAHGNVE